MGKHIIVLNDLKLPNYHISKEAKICWDYTCRVCDDDTYDGCDKVLAEEFFEKFDGVNLDTV